jgi:hypothetical protein
LQQLLLFVFDRLKKVEQVLVVFVKLEQQEQELQLFFIIQQQFVFFSFQLTYELFLIQEQSLLPFGVSISAF